MRIAICAQDRDERYARYFIEAPATAEKIARALARCLSDGREKWREQF